jgi:hypothetical protein
MTRAKNVNPYFRHTFGGRMYDMTKIGQQGYGLLLVLYASKPSVDKPRRTLLGLIQILDQNGADHAKPRHLQGAT